jgi:hypothetical protein
MKEKLTALLAVFLVMFSVLPTSAAAAGNQRSTDISVECTLPNIEIEVTVPSNASVAINPYGLDVTIRETVSDEQILFDTAYITNETEVPISVSASVTASINEGSDMQLLKRTTKGLKIKAAFVYLEMQAVESEDPDDIDWDSSYNAKKHIIVSETTSEKADFVTIGAASQDDHYGAFQLTGDCVTSPRNDPWTEDDGFTAKIVFTFKAVRLTA